MDQPTKPDQHEARPDSVIPTGAHSCSTKCSNQADLHPTLIDPIHTSDLPKRPSLASMRLAPNLTVALAKYGKAAAKLPLDPVTARTNSAP